MNQPNLKYDHIFAVLRYDSYVSAPIDPTDQISVLRVFITESEAIMEANRLNALFQSRNQSGAIYFVRQGRILKGLLKIENEIESDVNE